jgi:membrane-bound ClpP family serine protease
MSGPTVIAGAIAFLLGLVGLLELYGRAVVPVDLAIVSVVLTADGALFLFAAITLIGIGLIVGGIATLGDEQRVVVPPRQLKSQVVVVQPSPSGVVYETLSELELSVLRLLSQGKSEDEIATSTGVEKSVVSEKIAKLQSQDYITDKHTLTVKGLEALRLQDAGRMYISSTA